MSQMSDLATMATNQPTDHDFELENSSDLCNSTNGTCHVHYLDYVGDDMMPTDGLLAFYDAFLHVHGYLGVVICVFGILTNIFNITVLVARDMRSATNFLLTCMAVSDILTMLPYTPILIHFYCPPSDPMLTPYKYTYSWVLYMIVVVHVTATTHTISIWLAVTLAAFRFAQIRSPCPRGPLAREMRIRQVKLAALVIPVTSVLVLIPTYISQEIVVVAMDNTTNHVVYGLKKLHMGTPHRDFYLFANILVYALLGKIIPSLLILVFSGSLLYHMGIKTRRRRQRLSANRTHGTTTGMLLVVLVLFILTELPQGILLLLNGTVPGFYQQVSFPLGEFLDFASLLNNAINFVLYCLMSQQFREKFFSIYVRPICDHRPGILNSTSELLILREHTAAPRTTVTNATGAPEEAKA